MYLRRQTPNDQHLEIFKLLDVNKKKKRREKRKETFGHLEKKSM